MKGKALRKHSLHEKTAASVLLKLFISFNILLKHTRVQLTFGRAVRLSVVLVMRVSWIMPGLAKINHRFFDK